MDGFDGLCDGDTIPLEEIHSTEPPKATDDKGCGVGAESTVQAQGWSNYFVPVQSTLCINAAALVNSSVKIKDGSPTNEIEVNAENGQVQAKNCDNNQSNSNNYDERSTIETEDKPYYGLKPSLNNTFDSQKANKYRKYAIAVSWVSILTTLAICVLEFIVSYTENSTAAFGLAFSAVLDLMSSAVVLWRYYKSYDTFSMRRENISCVVLGVLFLLSSISIGVKAIYTLNLGEMPNYTAGGLGILIITSIVSSVLCTMLVVVKFILSRKLASRTLLTDAADSLSSTSSAIMENPKRGSKLISDFDPRHLSTDILTPTALNSLAAAIIALSIVVSSEVEKHSPQMWYLDPSIGLVVSLTLLIYGCWLLLNHAPELHKH